MDSQGQVTHDGEEYGISPNTSVIGRVIIKNNASVWFGAVLRGDNELLIIGENSNVQDNSVLHTDDGVPLVIGADVTIGHRAMIHGAVVGDQSLIGIGAILLNGARIGRNCIVGAPARGERQVTAQERAMLAAAARRYVENWRRFRASFRPIEGRTP